MPSRPRRGSCGGRIQDARRARGDDPRTWAAREYADAAGGPHVSAQNGTSCDPSQRVTAGSPARPPKAGIGGLCHKHRSHTVTAPAPSTRGARRVAAGAEVREDRRTDGHCAACDPAGHGC
jgi:hypothetical protein